MERLRTSAVLGDWSWFFAFALLSSIWCLCAAGTIGATFDEPGDLNNGLDFWRTGSHDKLLFLGAMPLPMDLASLPGYLWERTQDEAVDFSVGAPYEQLFWARVPVLLFWWVLLVYGRLIGRNLAGPWGGRLAVALLAVEPTLLAHAALATKDIAVTACMAAFVYHYRTGREGGWRQRIGWPAFWFAAALLSKASAVVFGPICAFALETERLARLGAFAWPHPAVDPAHAGPAWRSRAAFIWEQYRPYRREGFQMLGLGMLLVFVYCGCDWQPQQSFLRWANTLPDDAFGTTMVWTAEHLRIFRNAGDAIARQVTHNIRGDGVFLFGTTTPGAVWYYFPLVLTMKLTVPLLALPLVAALIRPRTLTNWACVAAGALLVFSIQCRVQLGVRLMLPLVGIAVPGIAAACVNAGRALAPGLRHHLYVTGVGVGLAWSAGSAAAVWPNGLCYVNELYGGTDQGYLAVSDGNYDWGQGLPELARWQQRHGASDLDVWYFGTDPALDVFPFRKVLLHTQKFETQADAVAATRGRYLAVSTTLVYGTATHLDVITDYLRRQEPAARTQTFLIYDFRASSP